VAPLSASSGKINRHRLNRGGDRIANNALWRIVLVRMSFDSRTRYYADRRTKEGLSKKEIIRCLKRYAAQQVDRRSCGR
jgi:transposase